MRWLGVGAMNADLPAVRIRHRVAQVAVPRRAPRDRAALDPLHRDRLVVHVEHRRETHEEHDYKVGVDSRRQVPLLELWRAGRAGDGAPLHEPSVCEIHVLVAPLAYCAEEVVVLVPIAYLP